LDLDQFKVVNDTCGHVGGDDLLIRLGALLQSRLRPTDTLARLGGDEFGVLMRGRDEVAGRWVAERLRSAVDEFCFIWSDKSFRIGVSIGMVMIDSASTDSGQLMSAADIACYAAKESGRNNIHQYQNKDEVLVQRYSQMEWISRITQAIEDGRLRLFVQKIVSTTPGDSDTQCYETLLRMIDKDGSVIVPMAFLPAAERYNLMRKIDRWVVERLFALMREFPRLRDMHISVNLSGQTLGDQQLLNWIRDQLDSTAVNPERVMFEVTETVAIANLQTALTFMRDVRDKGCTIALDDFGSGLSSFNYLKTLPVDIIKIDGHFVKDVLSEPINAAVVESIVQISRHLGLKTVAEYVETQSIANTLKQIGVDYLQGFHVAKPVPIETLVASNATAPSPPRYSDKPLFEQKYPGNLIATP
jgi:Amt family ammonium transporter